MRRAAACLLLPWLAACGAGAGDPGAGDCQPPFDPGPITVARAAELAPAVQQGVALATTRVWGDCRPRSAGTSPVDACGASLCLRGRAPLRVLVVPTGVSLALTPACPDGPSVAAAAAQAALDLVTSEAGEAVEALPAGTYRPYLAGADGCARCGDPGAGVCQLTVAPGRVTLADLVLDEAAH